MKCEWCSNEAKYLITKMMQPSPPRMVCESCRKKLEGYMTIKEIK